MTVEMEERLLDLLYKQAVSGLDDDEANQLREMEAAAGSSEDARSIEATTASMSMVGLDTSEEMPEHLKAKVLADAKAYFSSEHSAEAREENVFTPPRAENAEMVMKTPWWNWLGWAVAAAACLLLAVNLYTTRTLIDLADKPPVTPTPEERLTPAEQRQRLIDSQTELARANWDKGNLPQTEGISGDVVWSDARQAGYLRISGLPRNDPKKETYQLWIFDETQDEKTPIDGGTFDIASDGEVIVPIDAKLTARNAKAFAITIEKPGGVVVSDRKRVAGLAKRET